MTRAHIDERMKLHILNLCLATVTGDAGNLATAKNLLLDAVEKLVRDAKAGK